MTELAAVGVLGRIPPALGGGGLELQISRTGDALERLGHRVVRVDEADASERFDVLHAFGSEPAVWHQLSHWTRNPAPLVITPVVVVSPGLRELALRLSTRVPVLMTGGRMRAQLLRRADAVIAGTEYERVLLGRLGADPARTTVLGNGADSVEPGDLPEGVPGGPFVLSLGAVTPRKRVAEAARALPAEVPLVVAGRFAGEPSELGEWERAVRETGAVWLGEVPDPGAVAALQRNALALVHLSEAEVQSLAVLETLAQGTPVVLSDIPGHRELRSAHPDHVQVVAGPAELPAAVAAVRAAPPAAPAAIPTWEEVAAKLGAVYAGLGRP